MLLSHGIWNNIVLFIYFNNCFHLNKMMETDSCVTLLTLVWGWLCWTGWRWFRVAPVGAAGGRHKLNKGPPCCTGAACCCIVTEISHGDYHHLVTFIIWKYWLFQISVYYGANDQNLSCKYAYYYWKYATQGNLECAQVLLQEYTAQPIKVNIIQLPMRSPTGSKESSIVHCCYDEFCNFNRSESVKYTEPWLIFCSFL